jgi:hypothetical protein
MQIIINLFVFVMLMTIGIIGGNHLKKSSVFLNRFINIYTLFIFMVLSFLFTLWFGEFLNNLKD